MYPTKRSIVLILILLLCLSSAFPQESTSPKEDNLYSVALFTSVAEMEKEWGYIDDGDRGNRIRTDYRRALVQKNPEITGHLPSAAGDYHVEFFDERALIESYKSKKKEFSVLEIHPMRNEGKKLKIQVSVSWVKYEKEKLILEFSDWSDVEFRYDCEEQKYVVSAVKLGGI